MSGDHVRGKRTVTARRRSLGAEAAAVGAAVDSNVEDTAVSTPARGEARRGRAKSPPGSHASEAALLAKWGLLHAELNRLVGTRVKRSSRSAMPRRHELASQHQTVDGSAALQPGRIIISCITVFTELQ
ncbi:hypothetical protein B0H13DRAFT_2312492 [Mycena leptocephala]|nr:hypothetical protein B0H13DRAFT_2312492 [Mycena leptocephala]